MSLRRLVSALSVVVATGGVVLAQPKAPTPAPVPAPAPGTPAPAEGSAVQPIEDAPPSDMEGKDENPDAPRGTEVKVEGPVVAVEKPTTGYPIEETLRPITLPANMAEVSIAPHAQASPYMGADALRARYGITPQIQLGLTYVFAGIYDDPATVKKDYGFHPGKAGGLDVTVLVQNWLAIKAGVPVYLDPFAMSLALGAPMKWAFGNGKYAIGAMDDVLNIALPVGAEFAPTFNQEQANAKAANNDTSTMGTATQSRGTLRFSGYGVYQHKPNLALIGRLAIEIDDFSPNRNDRGHGGTVTAFRGGAQFTPRKFLDVGGYLGFDDLSDMPHSFSFAGFLALRI